jgi:adenylate cyclase
MKIFEKIITLLKESTLRLKSELNFDYKLLLKNYLLISFCSLIIILGSVIVGFNYFAFNKSNTKSAQAILLNLSNTINAKTDAYFNNSETGLLNGLLLLTQPQYNFTDFLQKNKLITAVYQADPNGNFYMMQRMANNQFATIHINKSAQQPSMIESVISRQGETIKTMDSAIGQYDPSTRPWYKKTLQSKQPNWTDIYRFYAFANVPSDLGVTFSMPVFDSRGQIINIFAIDISLNALAEYLKSINLGKDGAVYFVDSANNIKYLVLSRNVRNSEKFSYPTDNVQTINDLNLPWAEAALSKFKETGKKQFLYKFDSVEYAATILSIPDKPNWYLVSVKSLSSLLSLYTTYSRLMILFGMLLILSGVTVGAIFIIKLNRPIKNLLLAIDDLRQLKFRETEHPKTHVKEIDILYDTLGFMETGFKSFARYVPLALIQKMMSSGTVAEVSGESREISILFTDIRSFSSIAENMSARELMFYLSEYFEMITNIIASKGGTLDKYIGDAVMAFWGAPFDDKNHALHTCQCALMIQEGLERLNKVWKQKGLPELSLRFGINSGHAVVGNVGSKYRLSYTAMGDSVNLSNRLEELNKQYGTTILVGEDTYRAVSDQFLFRMIDFVETRGKKESVYIYELLQRKDSKYSAQELKVINAKFREIFNVYQVGEWQRAIDMFNEFLKEYPDDHIAIMFIERCQKLKANPPKKWNGAWSFNV